MDIKLRRIAKRSTYTIGKLSIDGEYFCDTLEDVDRGLSDDMEVEEIMTRKVYGQTAIPIGTYKVGITYWAKHKKNVPYLADVKGFSGILIHAGSSSHDTLGCILVGRNTIVGRLTDSLNISRKLTSRIRTAMAKGEKVRIKIE